MIFLPLLTATCSTSSHPEVIEEVLLQAGGNRAELEKVLAHYEQNPADSLKLRAAYFLIANMPGKYSEYYAAPWSDVAAAHLRWTSAPDRQLLIDSYELGSIVIEDDVTHITAEYLINNIDLSFKVWREQPWGKNIAFDVFCEEILPYRVSTEPLENWREKALATYADAYESFTKDTLISTVEACARLNSMLPRFKLDGTFPVMNFSQLMTSARGPCDAMVALAIFAMRALGIPVMRDYTPKWPHLEVGHSWNSVNDGKGGYVSFMGAEENPYQPHHATRFTKYKIFRQTFGKQANIDADESDIPFLLQDRYMKDVSAEYSDCKEVVVPMLFKSNKSTKYAYLAVGVDGVWTPIAWGKLTQGKIKFAAVGKKLVYLPVHYIAHRQKVAGYPFWIDDDGGCHFIRADTLRQKVLLTGIAPDNGKFLSFLLHGRFEGANRSDFSDAKILYSINEVRGGFYHTASIGNPSKFRYLRYFSPEGGRCNLAELDFFDKNDVKLTGKIIGMRGSGKKEVRENAFDGNVATAVDIDNPNDAWIGLDLGKPVAIGKIRFLPRTEGQNIYEGHTYELSYWSGQQWISLERQVAASHYLCVLAPRNALFRLHNVTQNKTGRYFMMENGVQRWL
jgi:hypothetical protein